MNKMKTCSAAKKRFKKLGSGKIKRWHAYHRHLLTKKNAQRKRDLRQATFVSSADLGQMLKLLPY